MIDDTTTSSTSSSSSTTRIIDAEALFAGIVEQLSDIHLDPALTGPQAFAAMKQILLAHNLLEHFAS
ncbi:hypothetical protein ACLQ3C_21720, partial [Gordonia sp. DT30]